MVSPLGELSVITLRGRGEAALDGVYIERPMDPANGGLDMALLNTSVVVVAPTGSERLASRGADMALNDWRKACQRFAGAAWSTSSFTKEADWEFRPPAGEVPAALAQVPCRGCADPLLGLVVLVCPASKAAGMSIRTYWPGGRTGATVPFRLDTPGGLTEAVEGRVQADATVVVPVPLRATPGLIDWLAEGNTLRLRYLSSSQTIILPLKLRDRWRESCAVAPAPDVTPPGTQATPGPSAPLPGSRMARYVGTYDVELFLADGAVGPALAAGLRVIGIRRLRANLQVTGPIEKVGSMVVLRGQAARRGGEEEAIVTTDLSGELVEAALMSGRKIRVYSSAGRPAPGSVVLGWAQERSASRTIEFIRQ